LRFIIGEYGDDEFWIDSGESNLIPSLVFSGDVLPRLGDPAQTGDVGELGVFGRLGGVLGLDGRASSGHPRPRIRDFLVGRTVLSSLPSFCRTRLKSVWGCDAFFTG
jgi:hypothetical protein